MIPKTNLMSNYKQELEKKLTSVTYSLYLLGKCFGACPIYLQPHPKRTIAYWLVTLLHILWDAIIMTILLYTMYSKFLEYLSKHPWLTIILNLIQYIFSSLNTLITMIGCYYQRKSFAKYFSHIIEIDVKLQCAGAEPFFCNLKSYLIKSYITIFLFLSYCFVLIVVIKHFDISSSLETGFTNIVPNVIIFLALLKYFALLHILQERYKQISIILKSLLVQSNWKNNISNYFKASQQMHNKMFELKLMDPVKQQTNEIPKHQTISALQQIFHELTVLELNTSKSFGILTMCLISSSFIIICSQLYSFYRYTQDSASITTLAVMYKIVWIIMHFGKVIMVLYQNDKVAKEVRKL